MSDDRIGPYQIGSFTLCGVCLIMDGFDVQAIGYVAPAIIQDWKIPAADMGPVFSAVLAGELMRNHWTAQDLFHAAAVPAAISALAIVALRWTGRVA